MAKAMSEKFANCVNDLIDFESVHAEAATDENLHSLEVLRVELNSLWEQVKRAYLECRDHTAEEGATPIDKNKLRTHYKDALACYKRCLSSINDDIQTISDRLAQKKEERESQAAAAEREMAPIKRLPPCDTDIFYGGYAKWPTFRDLFSILYGNNTRLSKVEKLFHLTQKTGGEARELISHVPLTHDGFDIAWKILEARYENKRMQVNEQIKTLFDLPNVSIDSGTSIQKLQRTMNSCLQTLSMLNIETTTWNPIIIYLSSTKLPRPFLEEFEKTLPDCTIIPTWQAFDKFLTHKFKTLESVENIKPLVQKSNPPKPEVNKKQMQSYQTNVSQATGAKNKNHDSQAQKEPHTTQEHSCQLCKENHTLRVCPKFLGKMVNDRIHIVKVSHLCYNCLSKDHGVKECKSRFSCRECRQRHHTLLHKGIETQFAGPTRGEEQPTTSSAALATLIQSTSNLEPTNITTLTLQESEIPNQNSSDTLLFTAIVQIESRGQRYNARAIIDTGSQSSFISDKLKNKLKLPTKRNLVHVTGLSQTVSETSTKACLFSLCSRVDPQFKLEVWAPVLKTLPSNLPSQNLNSNQLKDTEKLELADPKFYASRPIDLLIGMDVGPLIFTMGVPMKTVGPLIAQKTVFGWIIGGPLQHQTRENHISLCNTMAIEKILTRFWEVEETPKKILRSEEDKFCEENFKTTTRRNDSGRYIVTLPFNSCEELGSSRNNAMAQFLRMESKLLKTPEIKAQYDQTILEYLEMGHMRKISNNEMDKYPHYYLPHHAVIKPDRLTTKLRVVFNASSPTSNKMSLNDVLHPGPILQQDLVIQILKWRFFKYVFNADVTKMYRQILVDPSQTQFQRILFRSSTTDSIEDFELLTVTFGVNCAPFLALRTLLQLAEDIKELWPVAADIIQQNLYVDDVLAGGHTVEEALIAREQLNLALDSAGFELRKWSSNDPRLIAGLPTESLLPVDWLDLSEDTSTKTLGIRWNITSDSFTLTTPEVDTTKFTTKREVLSTIAKLFDPCGWMAPVIVIGKLIMQQVWLDKIDWDDKLKPVTQMNWNNFVKTCHEIANISVQRWIEFTPNDCVEFHGFCDASESAYAATIYIRVETEQKDVHTFLLASKTRVAPIKKISLPRLELCGAVLLANLASTVTKNLQLQNIATYYWTDSTIVLAWLKKPPCSWSNFVGNRVSEILECVDNAEWHHVDSESNPADVASRGCSPAELESHKLWWHGPTWLKRPRNQWPINHNVEDTNIESKPLKVFATTTYEDPLIRFSSLPRAYRVLAYALRFWRNTGSTRTHLRISSMEITKSEIEDIKTRLLTLTQKYYFSSEYQALERKSQISSNSPLITLNPFLDSKAIIRANGRLVQSPTLTYNERHPILLPYDAKLTQLLVEFCHKITIHGGNQLMTRILRSEFWIFRLKPLVKKVIHHCKTCTLFKQQTQNQIMAALPPERTLLSRPFHNTGVDFAGPFPIKNFTGRACLITKGYVCIFVCFATKAVHLEVVSDLSKQAFLAALDRFIGRRGCPIRIYSDNGTNFVGAAEMIRKDRIAFLKGLQNSAIQQNISHNLDWSFIPPGAPHMGGLWEAGVKSFKTHLRKFIPNMNFTFEEFSTILARIESCLNSRPLSPATDDPSDLSPLTPGHFLIGTPMLAPAEPDLSEESLTLSNRWKRLKVITQNFCHRWKSEYLNELHRRYKWKNRQDNIKVDDLVILRDEKTTPNEWKMGRITKTYPGPDQNVRVVELRTSNGVIKRPITKVIKLFPDAQ